MHLQRRICLEIGLTLGLQVLIGTPTAAFASEMRRIPGGSFQLFNRESTAPGRAAEAITAKIAPFELDVHAVTNRDYLAFVKALPKWQRGRVPTVFADDSYLSHWAGTLDPGKAAWDLPVTNVSWFAARAYCQWRQERLPSLNEWEYAASPETFGSDKNAVTADILAWYSKPVNAPTTSMDGKNGRCNVYGICGLHGSIWEWVEDYNSVMIGGENRTSANPDSGAFCGAASLGAMDPSDYAAFMRYAFRASLKGGYTVGHLGFRCAK